MLRQIIKIAISTHKISFNELFERLYSSSNNCKEAQLLLELSTEDEVVEQQLNYDAAIKHRLKLRLETLLLNNQKNSEQGDRINTPLRLSEIAHTNGSFDLACKYIKTALKRSQTESNYQTQLIILERYYAIEYDRERFGEAQKIDNKINAVNRLIYLESQASQILRAVLLSFQHKKKTKNELLRLLHQSIDSIKLFLEESETNGLKRVYHLLILRLYSLEENEKLHNYIDTVLNTSSEHRFLTESDVHELYTIKAHSLFDQRQYYLVIDLLIHTTVDRSSYTWFEFQLLIFKAYTYSKDYSTANEVIERMLNNKAFGTTSKSFQDSIAVAYGFLCYAKPGKKIEDRLTLDHIYNGFLEFSKDKLGWNCQLIALEFLYYIESYRVSLAIDRKESLVNYTYKNLKTATDKRPDFLFFKLIILAIDNNFDYNRCKVKGDKLYQELIDSANDQVYAFNLNVIPYDHLWHLSLIKMLQKGYSHRY